jgi:hypothetical protein
MSSPARPLPNSPQPSRSDDVAPASRGRWTFRLGRWLGIDVYVHATFLALLAFFALRDGMSLGAAAGAAQLAWMVALFGFVVLHEYGHALAARYFGIGTQDITLYPIGGVARLDSMPRSPGSGAHRRRGRPVREHRARVRVRALSHGQRGQRAARPSTPAASSPCRYSWPW